MSVQVVRWELSGARAKAWCLLMHAEASLSHSLLSGGSGERPRVRAATWKHYGVGNAIEVTVDIRKISIVLITLHSSGWSTRPQSPQVSSPSFV